MWQKQLTKDSIIYGLGSVLAKSIGIITIPIYTRAFSPEIYGKLEFLITLGAFFTPIMTMGTDSAFSYYFYNFKKNLLKDRITVFSTVLLWRIIWGTIILLSFYFIITYFNGYFLQNQINIKILYLIAFSSYLTILVNLFTNLQRMLFKPKSYITYTFTLTFLSSIISIILVFYFNMSFRGIIFGNTIALFLVLIVIVLLNLKFISMRTLKIKFLLRVVKFSFPFLPEALMWYLFSFADRWFILKILGEKDLGIYALGAKIGLLLILTTQAFRLSWTPFAMKKLKVSIKGRIFSEMSRYYLGFTSILALTLTFFSKLLLFFLTTEKFYESYIIVGPMAIQTILSSFNLIIGVGILKKEKTYFFPICLFFGVLSNI